MGALFISKPPSQKVDSLLIESHHSIFTVFPVLPYLNPNAELLPEDFSLHLLYLLWKEQILSLSSHRSEQYGERRSECFSSHFRKIFCFIELLITAIIYDFIIFFISIIIKRFQKLRCEVYRSGSETTYGLQVSHKMNGTFSPD